MSRKPTGNPPGRPKGATNKQTLDVKELARDFTEEAVRSLAQIMRKGESEAARVAAIKELLDRGHGKSTQVVDANVSATVQTITRKIVDPGA